MNPELISEATEILTEWAIKKGLLVDGSHVKVSITIQKPQQLTVEFVNSEIDDETKKLDALLASPIFDVFHFTTRARNLVSTANLSIVGDLVRKTEEELLKYKYSGRKTVGEIMDKVHAKGLKLGTNTPVGPLEKEAVLKSPILQYVGYNLTLRFNREGWLTVHNLLRLTLRDITEIFSPSDIKDFGSPKQIYAIMQTVFENRGVL